MGTDVVELADRIWRGETDITSAHPLAMSDGDLVEVADGVAFVPAFANVSAFATGEGLALVDTGSFFAAASVHERIRAWTPEPLHTAVYSHGHVDHVFGVRVFEEEAERNGWARPRVVAHRDLPRRFDRYDNRIDLDVGGLRIELHHARGETDDHTWTWLPDKRVLCCGDFFIWASPNAGNPQKVQRYPLEWAQALRSMAALRPEVMLPGHGFPVIGEDRVARALRDTAELLESLHDQVVELMNAGARLDEVIHSVQPPEELLARPYLRPVYDEPEFVVRNLWRLYGGWYDGNPANLKPAPESDLAREIARLAGGAGRLAARASALAAEGSLRLAGHLAELAVLASPADSGAHHVRAEVFAKRAEEEASTMSKGVFSWASSESRGRLKGSPGG
jgi:alkyl sulfatase BDS1-like metallo-beta-lactamase superfamily hydrolase